MTRRLLIVATVPSTLNHFLAPYARHLRGQGWQVDGAAGAAPASPARSTDAFDRLHELPWDRRLADRRNWTVALPAVRRLLTDGAYDVVHVHTPVAAFLTRAAVASMPRRARPRVVYTAHGFHFHPGGSRGQNLLYRGAERWAGRWTDRLLVINEHDLAAVRRHRIVPSGRVELTPGVGVDLGHYRPSEVLLEAGDRLRSALGITPGDPVFTVVAELQPGKRHLDAVRALARFPERAHLICAGTGPMRDAVEQEARALGVAGRVHLLGSLADVRPAVLAARATILLSEREGLSRAVMESLALGVPVIGTRVRGIADLVVPEAGVLVEVGDIGAVVRAMSEVTRFPAHPLQRQRLEPWLERFSLPALLDLHTRLYTELLPRESVGAPAQHDGAGPGVELPDRPRAVG